MDSKSYYLKKVNARKLSSSLEYSTAKVGWQITIGLAAILAISGIDVLKQSINTGLMAAAGVYLASGMLQYFVTKKIRKDLVNFSDIKDSTRKIGYLLVFFIVTGNIFMSTSGFMLIKKAKPIEYQLAVYAFLITIMNIIVSALNIFKPYVADYFVIGMIALVVLAVMNIVTMLAIHKYVNGRKVDKKAMPIAIIALLGIAAGNIFSFILGLIMITKMLHKDDEISIEWIDVVRRLFKNYMAVIGLFFVIFLLSIALVSYLTFDYDIAISNNYALLLNTPSLAFPFGTDNFGRCVFTRIVFGARISLLIGVVSTLIPIVVGGLLGALAGYYGRRTDNIIMRALDILYAVPGILLAIAIIAAFGANTVNLIIALSIGSIPMYARTVRATVMTLADQEFVEAAKACGARNMTIILKHIIPNALAPVIVRATLGIGGAVLSTSSLSYLGLGVEPHIPEWGTILKAGSTYLETNPYIAIFPGIAIILIVLSFNYFGDGLRDALDPKLK